MNTPRVPPRFVPTLTEVVEFEEAQVLDEPVAVQAEPVALVPAAFEPTFAPALSPVHSTALAPVPSFPSVPAPAPVDIPVADVETVVADAVNDWSVDAPPAAEWTQPVQEAQVVAPVVHPEAVVATGATEDVPAFLLATQPVPMWSPPAESAAVEPEPVLSAIVSKPMVATEPTVAPVAEVVAAASVLDAEREEQIVQSVLTELQRRSDLMLEYRLRETLTPILARLCDTLIKEAREDLAATLRDVVSRAVAQELTRHRPK